MLFWILPSILLVFGGSLIFHQAESCNEAVCGSVVSKCLLTQSCKCELPNCTCCKDCANCLSYLYSECCSCVNICPKSNDTPLNKKSHVEEIGGVPGLFNVLTESPDPNERWESLTFPIDVEITDPDQKKIYKTQMQSAEQRTIPIKMQNFMTVNCTVAFVRPCLSWVKCKQYCTSMGASSYRWFHDGCCECVGQHCINYGINESRCKNCRVNDEDSLDGLSDDDQTYGEDEDDLSLLDE